MKVRLAQPYKTTISSAYWQLSLAVTIWVQYGSEQQGLGVTRTDPPRSLIDRIIWVMLAGWTGPVPYSRGSTVVCIEGYGELVSNRRGNKSAWSNIFSDPGLNSGMFRYLAPVVVMENTRKAYAKVLPSLFSGMPYQICKFHSGLK